MWRHLVLVAGFLQMTAAVVSNHKDYNNTFMWSPGDLYIGGLFPVHNSGRFWLSCSDIRLDGPQYMDAFKWTIDQINKKVAPFQDLGIKIGGIALDDCHNVERGARMVHDIHRDKSLKLMVPNDFGKEVIDPDHIMGWIASTNSGNTMAVAENLMPLNITQISWAATSTVLSEQRRFPYFLRTVPADNNQVKALVQFFIKMGWTKIQTVMEDSAYGRQGINDFLMAAINKNLCLAQSYTLEKDDSNVDKIIIDLLKKPEAPIVLIFSEVNHAKNLLVGKKFHRLGYRLIFVGSEAWGDDTNIVTGSEEAAHGMLTFKVSGDNIVGFNQYLGQKQPEQYPENPFFDEYYYKLSKCTKCSGAALTSLPTYSQDQFVFHEVNAVYAMALGIHNTLKEICGDGYQGLCPKFRAMNITTLRPKIFMHTEEAKFKDYRGRNFHFVNRESNLGYDIFRYYNNRYQLVSVIL